MSKIILDNASLVINSVDLSDHVQSITLNYEAEAQDSTTMGQDTRGNIYGLKNWSVDVSFAQDFAAGEVDATLFGIVGTSVTVVIKPDAGAVSATNPSYSANGVVGTYSPMGNSVGELAVAPVTIMPADSSNTLVRATS